MKSLYAFLSWVTLTASSAALAQTSCSTVAAGNWENNAIWSCGSAPTSSFSGTIIIAHATVQLNSTITMNNQITVVVRPGAIFRVDGSNGLVLTNNASKADVQAGATVTGQSANSIIRIGTSPQFTYTMNGSNAIAGPTTMTNTGLTTLPVELVYFKAVAEGNRVSLAWATSSEQNAARYVVERSRDLGEFVQLGNVPAVGNSQVRQQYGLIDQQPLVGDNYYRLRQLDRNGQATYSRPVHVRVAEGQPGVIVLGNPAQAGTIRLATNGLTDATYRLTTLQGRDVAIDTQPQINGEVTLKLQDATVAGLYLLVVQHTTGQVARRILIQ